jgi:HD superfamily phosphohydrolase YqeK
VLFGIAPEISSAQVKAVWVLGLMALAAELLGYSLPAGGATGSIAFIPYLAMVTLVPAWFAVLMAAGVSGLASGVRGSGWIKVAFNFSQVGVSAGAAALVFIALGEASIMGYLSGSRPFSLAILLAIAVACLVHMLLNISLVAGVIALSGGKQFGVLWKSAAQKTAAYDAVSSPVVYLLAWMYAYYGPLGAVIFAAPLLLLREVYKTNRQLERVNLELLELMVKAIEARDPYTSGHSRRVSQYSKIIARGVGLSGSDIERIGIAALLHDVGKIHEVYAPILRKPEKLNPAEWAVMQTHPIKSAELVATVSHLKDIVAPVRHHHENWDGTGYPDGLQGEQIPLAARIVLFADTIDAMTTDRPYRKALSEAQVRSELVKFRGKQFDPEMCDKLLASPMFGLLFAPHQRETTPEHTAPVLGPRSERAVARS